jgi:hypothetical protein
MFAHASNRGAACLRTAGRHLHLQSPQLRPFHYPRPSPLIANTEPRKRHLLPYLARANATFALQTRGLKGSALPKIFLKAFRVPATGVAVFTGAFAYVNYKVQGSSKSLNCG